MSKCLHDVAEVHYGKSPTEVLSEDSPIPIIGTGGIYGRASRPMYNGPAVVVPRKGSLGNPQYVDEPFWPVDTTYAVIPKTGIDAKWLYYSLDTFDLTKLNEATGVPSISRDWLYRVPVGSEEYGEQRRIAEILSTVDEVIEQAEALIAKYQQIKAGLMHDLFTRGVTSDGRLRPTRAEAPHLHKESSLGWIPKEWEIGGVEDYLIQPAGMKPGPFGSSLLKSDFTKYGYRVYGQEQILASSLADGDYYISASKWAELRDFAVAEGDILMTLVGVGTIGRVLVVKEPFEPGIINPRVMRLRPNKVVCSIEFLRQLMSSSMIRNQFNRFATGGTMPVLNTSVVRMVRIPVVPLQEQRLIASVLISHDARLAIETKQCQKLRYQKFGLMHDLLTGRVCVKVPEVAQTLAR